MHDLHSATLGLVCLASRHISLSSRRWRGQICLVLVYRRSLPFVSLYFGVSPVSCPLSICLTVLASLPMFSVIVGVLDYVLACSCSGWLGRRSCSFFNRSMDGVGRCILVNRMVLVRRIVCRQLQERLQTRLESLQPLQPL